MYLSSTVGTLAGFLSAASFGEVAVFDGVFLPNRGILPIFSRIRSMVTTCRHTVHKNNDDDDKNYSIKLSWIFLLNWCHSRREVIILLLSLADTHPHTLVSNLVICDNMNITGIVLTYSYLVHFKCNRNLNTFSINLTLCCRKFQNSKMLCLRK